MDSLNNILGGKRFDEPVEVTAIKRFVREKYSSVVGVLLRNDSIVIVAPSASLINTLRLNSMQLKAICPPDRQLIFRIGPIPR